jgi:hypothetical protein
MQLKQMKIATADSNKTSNALLTLQTAYEVKKFYLCVYIRTYVCVCIYVFIYKYIHSSQFDFCLFSTSQSTFLIYITIVFKMKSCFEIYDDDVYRTAIEYPI